MFNIKSRQTFKTIVHQTLRDDDNPNHIEDNGPFSMEDIANSYLGTGYYFWDDHIELAEWWGVVHCKNKYVICEGNLEIDEELFFDLVGNRQDQQYLVEMIKRLNVPKMAIGKVIEMLKNLELQPNKKGVFPYKIIRACDLRHGSFKPNNVKFAENREGMTNLTPQMLICLIEKNKLHLTSYKIVFPDKYVEE